MEFRYCAWGVLRVLELNYSIFVRSYGFVIYLLYKSVDMVEHWKIDHFV